MTKRPPACSASPPPEVKPEKKIPVAEHKMEPARRTLRCRTVTEGRLRQLNYIRDLPPYALEGRLAPADDDAAPTPSEALLAALSSCFATAIRANATAHAITIKSLQLDIEADCDPSAGWRVISADGPKSVGIEEVRVTVHIEADAPRDMLKTLVLNAAVWSPVGNTIHDPVHLDVVLA